DERHTGNHWRLAGHDGDVGRAQGIRGAVLRADISGHLLHACFCGIEGSLTVGVIAAEPLVGHHHPGESYNDRRNQQKHQKRRHQCHSFFSSAIHECPPDPDACGISEVTWAGLSPTRALTRALTSEMPRAPATTRPCYSGVPSKLRDARVAS